MIFITGGGGFIGSHLVENLVKKGKKIRCLVRSDNKDDFFKKLSVDIIHGDITNQKILDKCLDNVDIIYNLAGINAKKGIPDEAYWKVHVQATENLMALALKKKIKRFVHCSSVAVLGNPEHLPANEKSPYDPQTIYEKTKMEGEKIALQYIEKGLPVVIIRPALNYGPRDFSGVYRLIKMIARGEFKFIGNGNNQWHMVYVDDCVKGFILAGERKEAIGNIFIIGGEKPTKVKDLIKLIALKLKLPEPKIHIPLWLARPIGKTGAFLVKCFGLKDFPITSEGINFLSYSRFYDLSKAKKILGYHPTMNIEKGIEETINWYKKNNYL